MTDLRTPPVDDGELFSTRARQYARDKPLHPIHVLEAGCGWGPGLDLGDRDHRVTGVDMEAPELRAYTCERTDLDDWHLGDLRTVPLPPRAFDVVHASYLIERVPHAELVLDRFVAALKPGGLLLVRLRDRDTAFGFLDRTLPGPLRGGAPAHDAPPPAVYDRVASREGMRWYCAMRGLVIAEEHTARRPLAAAAGRGESLCRLVALVSRGRLTAGHSELALVIKKPENRFARVI